MADVNKTDLANALREAVSAVRIDANDPRDIPWLRAAREALAQHDSPRSEEDQVFFDLAKEQASDELEVDDDAIVSVGEEGGFVQAWIFISNEEAGIEPEPTGMDEG
jgi:hypothetical protein